jgi:hypothetical protein
MTRAEAMRIGSPGSTVHAAGRIVALQRARFLDDIGNFVGGGGFNRITDFWPALPPQATRAVAS